MEIMEDYILTQALKSIRKILPLIENRYEVMGQGQSYCGQDVNDKRRENIAILSLEGICN